MTKSELPKELSDVLHRIQAGMDDESKRFAVNTVVIKVLSPEPYNMYMTFLYMNKDASHDVQLEEEGITCNVILSREVPITESRVLIPYQWIYQVQENEGGMFQDEDTLWYDSEVTQRVDFKKLITGEVIL